LMGADKRDIDDRLQILRKLTHFLSL